MIKALISAEKKKLIIFRNNNEIRSLMYSVFHFSSNYVGSLANMFIVSQKSPSKIRHYKIRC